MKKFFLAALLAVTVFGRANAADAVWLTDLAQAQAQAKAGHKIVLLDFTGSDWCGWCIKFKKEVLETPEFLSYAAKNVVLVEVDFPNKKPQSADLKNANASLKNKYDVHGYPTLLVLDQNGKEIGRQVGYAPGGAAAFITKLEGFKTAK